MTPIDTYRDAFLRFMAEGMTHAEALAQFEAKQFDNAILAEIDLRGADVNDDPNSLLNLGARAMMETSDAWSMNQAAELWLAGWTSEVPDAYRHNSKDFWRQCPTMSLYWRRPPKRAGKPGRRYLSTNQAWMALQREAKP